MTNKGFIKVNIEDSLAGIVRRLINIHPITPAVCRVPIIATRPHFSDH